MQSINILTCLAAPNTMQSHPAFLCSTHVSIVRILLTCLTRTYAVSNLTLYSPTLTDPTLPTLPCSSYQLIPTVPNLSCSTLLSPYPNLTDPTQCTLHNLIVPYPISPILPIVHLILPYLILPYPILPQAPYLHFLPYPISVCPTQSCITNLILSYPILPYPILPQASYPTFSALPYLSLSYRIVHYQPNTVLPYLTLPDPASSTLPTFLPYPISACPT